MFILPGSYLMLDLSRSPQARNLYYRIEAIEFHLNEGSLHPRYKVAHIHCRLLKAYPYNKAVPAKDLRPRSSSWIWDTNNEDFRELTLGACALVPYIEPMQLGPSSAVLFRMHKGDKNDKKASAQ